MNNCLSLNLIKYQYIYKLPLFQVLQPNEGDNHPWYSAVNIRHHDAFEARYLVLRSHGISSIVAGHIVVVLFAIRSWLDVVDVAFVDRRNSLLSKMLVYSSRGLQRSWVQRWSMQWKNMENCNNLKSVNKVAITDLYKWLMLIWTNTNKLIFRLKDTLYTSKKIISKRQWVTETSFVRLIEISLNCEKKHWGV